MNAIVDSYTDFIADSHKSVASEIATLMRVDLARVGDRLTEKTDQLLRAKQAAKDLGIDRQSDMVHPILHKVDKTHANLVDVHQKRIQLQASLFALRHAIEQGASLQQHLLVLEPTVGREVVLGALGLSTRDNDVLAHLERLLFEEQAGLETLSSFYLENHPQIQRKSATVDRLRQEIVSYTRRQSEIASETYNQRLGELLTSLLSEDLQQTWAHEQALTQEYQKAESEALQLASRWEGIRILEAEEHRLRNLDEALQTRLDNIDIKTDQSDVHVEVVSDAIADNRPVSPRLPWVLSVCGALGLGVGTRHHLCDGHPR